MSDPETEFDLHGKVVVLLGGGGILGRRFAAALASRGARVAVADRDRKRADDSAARANEKHPASCHAFEVDATDEKAVRGLHEAVAKDLGDVHGLVNALAFKSERFFEPFESYPLDDWNEVFAANCTAPMLACREFGPGMAERGEGSIVNILSIYGIVAPDNRIYEGSEYEGRAINTPAVYSASKAALLGLTRHLSTSWADRGVRVNAVTPGGVFSGQNETFVRKYSARVPMGRMAHDHEISGAVVFLLSSASSYVNGQNIVVDGGLTAW